MQLSADFFLFDMDGTLIDSTANVERVWQAWCQLRGVDLQQVLAICHGVPGASVVRQVAPHLDAEQEAIWLDQQELADCSGVHAMLGAAQMLHSLPAERWAIVTSAARAVMQARLAHCGLPQPQFSVCAEDVSFGKPHPEPYQLGAARLGAQTHQCIAFEDAPAGIRSAHAAGCEVVQIGHSHSAHPDALVQLPDWSGVSLKVWDAAGLAA